MRCLLIIGSSQTQWYDDRVFTPRRYPTSDTVRHHEHSTRTRRRNAGVARLRAERRRRRRRRHADRHRPDRCDVPRAATYSRRDTDLPATFAIKLSAQDDAVRERVALGYRSEDEFYAGSPTRCDPGAAVLLLRHLRRRRRFRAAARRHGARGAGRPDRRMHAGRGAAGRRGAGRPARPELVRSRSGPTCPASRCRSRATTPRQRASVRSRRWPPDITDRQARRRDQRRGPGNPHRGNVSGDAVADGRAQPVRADARRLPAGQHVVRSRPHPRSPWWTGRPSGSACPRGTWPTSPRPACPERPVGDRRDLVERYHRALLGYGVTDYDATPVGGTTGSAWCRRRCSSVLGLRLRRIDRARRRDDAGHARARLPGDPRAGQPGPGQR